MSFIGGVHLLPATGEFVYDTVPHLGAQPVAAGVGPFSPMNTFFAPGGSKTDYSYALDQLQAAHPECTTVSLVVAWFFNSENAATCNIYPSTNYLLGAFEAVVGGIPVADRWKVSGLTEVNYPGVIPLPGLPGTTDFVYGGTPSDPSVVRCIEDLKSRGFRVVFYPFLLGTGSGFPWRGRITYSPDVSSAATAAVNAFLGSASTGQFTRDNVNLTVSYSGNVFDWTYRRMILHYANLCVVAGGVDLFVIGSELRGLEIIRGPAWTKAGTTDGSGFAVWDYPFVAGLQTLANDVRSVFDGAGLTKDLTGLHNLITYSADWSSWMGWQHPGANGQWPHLDSLWASTNIDLVSFDNYLPLTDWTTGDGGIDATVNWLQPAPSGPWPPSPSTMSGLGLSGVPTIYSSAYLNGEHRGRPILQLVLFRREQRRPGLRSERVGPSSLAAGGRSPGPGAQPLFRQPAAARQQATAVVVEQYASGDLRHRLRLGSARPRHRVAGPVEVDHDARVRLLGDRQVDQPAERLLRRQVERERDAVLVDLGLGLGRRLSAAARRHDPVARPAGDL